LHTEEKPMPTVTVRIGRNNRITLSPDPVRSGRKPNVLITWRIDRKSPGWRFARHGIVIRGNERQFIDRHAGKTIFRWLDRNTRPGWYRYEVNLVKGATKIKLDPAIQNQGCN
jgi:hypothetical protein